MLDREFEELDESDLISLIENEESERRHIEYKTVLPTNSYDSKKEFLADVSSFANASGGHLIFGMKEEEGVPIELIGVRDLDPDEQILRLENMMRDAIEPRLQGVQIKAIDLSSGNDVFIIRIPRSWTGPHVIKIKGHWRFYSRNSAGKYPLDVGELRSAFIQSEGLSERIRSFRNRRLGSIISRETPVRLMEGALVILHLIPFVSFEQGANYSLTNLAKDPWSLKTIYNSVTDYRFNFDGFLTHGAINDGASRGYVQVFRNGILEVVDAGILKSRDERTYIPSIVFERELVNSLEVFLNALKAILVPPPVSLLVSLVGVKDYWMAVHRSLNHWGEMSSNTIDRNTLIMPEVLIRDFDSDVTHLLRPIFDAVWNATGWPRSLSYNDDGEFGKGPNWRR